MRCPKCGTEISAATKFCPECGAPLRRDVTGERRQVTVLFVDMVNSTSLAESWDPERLHELYAEYHSVCGEVIRRYDGHVEHFLGDGVLALFGYPTAHEDDAIRAVRTGLEIVDSVGQIRAEGDRLHLRVAIHTGVVVVGEVGIGEHGEQMVSGEVPNIAARLQSEADPDTVVISGATRQLVDGHFVVEDRGSRTLKGLSRPIRIFRVVSAGDAPSRFDAQAASGLTPLAGRQREVEAIFALGARAADGAGQALLLSGEAGIGKSRLLEVAREAAEERRQEVYAAQCSPYQVNSTLFPIAEMLERCLDLEREPSAEGKLELLERFVARRASVRDEALPLLAPLLSIPADGRYPEMDISSAKRRQRTLEVLTELILPTAGDPPLLMLVEDLHWADPTTLDLVAMIAERLSDAPIFLVLTTRQQRATLQPIAPLCTVLELDALPQADARALVANVIGGKPLPEEVTREIIARTGGVPLFVEAVTRTIIESGVLRELEDRYEASGPLPAGLIPATVHDSLMARIDMLGADKPVAQLASTVGREFGFELLHSVCDRSTEELEAALQRMVYLNLVSQSGVPPHSTYTFKHALVQDAAYESLLRKTRQEFHGRIAEVLLRRFPDLAESRPELLARHFEGAGRIEEAIDSWTKAGQLAQQRSAERECVAYLRRVLSLLGAMPADDPERIRREMAAQLMLAPALMTTEGWASREVEVACSRARDLCVQTQNHQGLLAALWGLWTVLFVRGEHVRALEAAQSVLQMALATDNRILHVAARHGVGFTHYYRGSFQAAREQAEQALALFDLEQEKALVRVFQIPSSVCCLAFLTQSLQLMGYPEQAKKRHRELESLVEALASAPCTAVGLGVGLYYDLDVRDVDAVARKAERGYALSVEEGFQFWSAAMQVYSGWAQSMRGNTAGGLAEIRAGLDGFARTGAGIYMPALKLMLAEALRVDGQADAALDALAAALRLVEEQDERYYEAELYRLRGEIQIEQGSRAEGESSLRRAVEVARGQMARLLELRAALVLGRLLRDQGRSDEARALLEPLYDGFTEGHDTRELIEARALLEELGAPRA